MYSPGSLTPHLAFATIPREMPPELPEENPDYLCQQLITYLGNKRSLLGFIGTAVERVRARLGKRQLACYDAFSGSGIVSRFLKRYAHTLYTNDLEAYAETLGRCYLANRDEVAAAGLPSLWPEVQQRMQQEWAPGLVAELYAPQNDADIRPGERAFYTRRNAIFLDTACRIIRTLPEAAQPFFHGPLLAEASVHTNTSGVFKGFYKNREGCGQFGGTGRNALSRILAPMELALPVFSRFDAECHILRGDACASARQLPEIDLAYLDPPYNQHPYGSNYFMLNFLLEYKRPQNISAVSGIPAGWNRSAWNRRRDVARALTELLAALPARFALLSYNSEGFVSLEELLDTVRPDWEAEVMEQPYATFRGCRNLRARAPQVKEYLLLLERR